MAAAEFIAGFDAKELPSDPTGLVFQMVEVDPEEKSITIGYTNGNPSNIDELVFSQGRGAFQPINSGRCRRMKLKLYSWPDHRANTYPAALYIV
jgi:hypothetical protein